MTPSRFISFGVRHSALAILAALCILGGALPSHAQDTVGVSKSRTTNELTSDLAVGSGRTLEAKAGSTVDLDAATVTLPGDITRLGPEIALASEVTGTLPVANGGTGASTAAAARSALEIPGTGRLGWLKSILTVGRQSERLHIFADSTGNDTSDWPFQWALLMAAAYPAYTVEYRPWDTGTDRWSSPTIIQTGTAGVQSITCSGGDCASLPASTAAMPSIALDCAVDITLPDWTPAQSPTVLAGRFGGSTSDRGWYLYITSTGLLGLQWSADGSNILTQTGGTLSLADGARRWVRVTLLFDNGAGAYEVKFFTSTNGSSWTQQGATVTGGATTSIYESTQPWQLLSRGTGAAVGAQIHRVRIRDGIDGRMIVPETVDRWNLGANGAYVGAPILDIRNGGYSGGSLATWSDATRLGYALDGYDDQPHVITALGHNQGGTGGATYRTALDGHVTAVRAKASGAAFVMVNQNPQKPTYTHWRAHDRRMTVLASWCAANSIPLIDAYRGFFEEDPDLSTLVSGDGVHPTDAGYQAWAGFVMRELDGS
ncbi:hypothetical protein ASA1KI_21180 [Opitutales bacterium ASA1]|uniref:SGNH/GDSL hydrolase family protein n=1 Tax=Congregicoccus parvus TaxID=3081749 RepID=UPI002B2F2396|nr:hypothetical protein ASA1KI_21180 [Opitutales bacterium ASA1]